MRIIQSANPRPLNLIAVGPNGLVAVASRTFVVPGDVEVCDVTSGRIAMRFANPDSATSLAFTADNRFVMLADAAFLRFIEVASGRSMSSTLFPNPRPEFALSADGERFLVTSSNDTSGEVSCFTTALGGDRRRLWHMDTGFAHSCPVFAPTGEKFAVAVRTLVPDWVRLMVQVRSAASGAGYFTVPFDFASPVRQLAFTADGAKLLVRTDSNTVQLFDAATGAAAAGVLKHKGRSFVTGIAVHPRGPVACARTDGTVTLWNAETREQLRVLDWKAGRLVSVAFAPDGALAAAGTEDGKIVVWDVDV